MKYKKFIVTCVIIAFAIFFSICIKSTLAVETTSISVSPLSFDLSANPGDTIVNEFLVRNSGKDSINISVESQDFVASGEEGEITLSDEKTTYSLTSWVDVDKGKFTLAGGKQQRVKFVIRVPYNAEPGGHYASVFAHLSPTTADSQSGAYVGQKIGSLVLLRVAGNVREEASIESFKTASKWLEKGPITFDLRIKNTGSVHIKPKGMIAITNIWGDKVADIPVDQKNVLPGAIRHMSAEWSDTPMIGKFTATVLSYYGQDNQQMTETTTFWIIPWKIILVITIIIAVAATLIYLGRRRLKEAFRALAGKPGKKR